MRDNIRSIEYGRRPTDKEVQQFNRLFPNPTTRRYSKWCDVRGINQALLKDMLDALPKEKKKPKTPKKPAQETIHNRRCFNKTEILSKMEDQDNRCVGCKRSLREETVCGDHIIPHARGGPTVMWNLQALCPDCNSYKRSKDPLIWAHEMGVTFPSEFMSRYYQGVIDGMHSPRIWRF